jgi:transcriptional regulator
MYVRTSHQPRSVDDVVEVMRANSFATMVSTSSERLVASHLPFVYHPEVGVHGTLFAHMARANEHAAVLTDGEALVIFSGPHGYISPSWYADRATAPTWDYVAVHCYGKPRVHSAEEAELNIRRLISVVEAARPQPWAIEELRREEIERMIRNIVSFEIPVDRIEAKFKLNQGEKRERTAQAVAQLELAGEPALAAYIRRYNDL